MTTGLPPAPADAVQAARDWYQDNGRRTMPLTPLFVAAMTHVGSLLHALRLSAEGIRNLEGELRDAQTSAKMWRGCHLDAAEDRTRLESALKKAQAEVKSMREQLGWFATASRCGACGKPAACVGEYLSSDGDLDFACDDCCGHSNEDGWCKPVPRATSTESKNQDA